MQNTEERIRRADGKGECGFCDGIACGVILPDYFENWGGKGSASGCGKGSINGRGFDVTPILKDGRILLQLFKRRDCANISALP